MLEGVNIEEIKKYNTSLKQCRDRAASLNAEIEYTNKEIDNLCSELSTELGVTVTRDNIEQIYNEQLEKINSTLQSGNAVLAKIASEESGGMQPVQPMVSAPATPVIDSTPSMPTPPMPPVQPVMAQSTPVAQSVEFSQPQIGGQPLPNFFGGQF